MILHQQRLFVRGIVTDNHSSCTCIFLTRWNVQSRFTLRETAIAAARSYFPTRSDLSGFLNLINVWWTIPNLRQMYTPNVVGNTIIFVDKRRTFTEHLLTGSNFSVHHHLSN